MSNNSVGHRRGRRDRPGAGDAGARRGPGAEHPVQPDPAQAGQRPDVTVGGARAGRGLGRGGRLLRAPRPRSPRWWPTNWPRCEPNSMRSSARAPDRPPRSTCGQPIWPTWGWRARQTCRSSWSATSTAAGCLPTCSARWRCSHPRTRRSSRASWSTSFAATRPCSAPGLTSCEELTGRPTYGVIPFDDGFWLDAEDSVSVQCPSRRRPAAAADRRRSGCGWRRSGCRASPTPPTSRRWPASPGCWCAG